MENDVVDAIETTASTYNEQNEEDSIPIELADEEERFQDGYGDKGPWFQTYQPVPIQQQKSTSDHVVEAIDTTAPTINEGNEDLIVPVDIVVEEERFKDGDGVEWNNDQRQSNQYRYNNNNKSWSGSLFCLEKEGLLN